MEVQCVLVELTWRHLVASDIKLGVGELSINIFHRFLGTLWTFNKTLFNYNQMSIKFNKIFNNIVVIVAHPE